jgi:hypothetical protein
MRLKQVLIDAQIKQQESQRRKLQMNTLKSDVNM